MSEFLSAVDIGNRALQHCGAEMMDATLGFAEVSKRARQVSFAYGKLRTAELRRNTWRFATKRVVLRPIDTNTMLLTPTLWQAGATYFVGSIVADGSGNLWISNVANNLGNDPQNTTLWEPYFGPLTVSLYTSTTAYSSGELVYTAGGDGTYRVYVSLQNANSDTPSTATAWSATATYFKNQVATLASVAYMSLIDLNLNQSPPGAALWAIGTTYGAAAKVGGSDGVIYSSIAGGNIGNDPTSDGGIHWTNTGVLNPWTTVFTGGTGSVKWLEIGGAEFPAGVGLATITIIYPLNAGPVLQVATRNAFRLPNGFLRKAPTDPKAGVTPRLGAPTGPWADDWLFEGDYIVSSETNTIMLRFVADVTDVRRMDAMFCEGLAARIGLEVCEPLTQSTAKMGNIAKIYKEWIEQARTVNGIEIGSEDPPMDDYLTVRF